MYDFLDEIPGQAWNDVRGGWNDEGAWNDVGGGWNDVGSLE